MVLVLSGLPLRTFGQTRRFVFLVFSRALPFGIRTNRDARSQLRRDLHTLDKLPGNNPVWSASYHHFARGQRATNQCLLASRVEDFHIAALDLSDGRAF